MCRWQRFVTTTAKRLDSKAQRTLGPQTTINPSSNREVVEPQSPGSRRYRMTIAPPPNREAVEPQSPGSRSSPVTIAPPPNREAVEPQSPGSRSAPWDTGHRAQSHPEGVQPVVAPLWGACKRDSARQPRVRSATLGFGIKPLRGCRGKIYTPYADPGLRSAPWVPG